MDDLRCLAVARRFFIVPLFVKSGILIKHGVENGKWRIHGSILFPIALMALIVGADSGWAKPQLDTSRATPMAPGRVDTLGR
jgi:hypothetical protein